MSSLPLMLIGPSGPGAVGQFTFVQSAQGNGTNQSGTCGGNHTTCAIAMTTTPGNFLYFHALTTANVTISSTGCGTYVPIAGVSTNGITYSGGGSQQAGYILSNTGCGSPITVTFSATANNAVVTVYEFSYTNGPPVLDAYGGVASASGLGTSFNGFALTTTGVHEIGFAAAYTGGAGTGVTAVASPWSTHAVFQGINNGWQEGTSYIINNSPTYPTPAWTAVGANTEGMYEGAAFSFGGTPSSDWTIFDPLNNSGSGGSVPAVSDLNANTLGYVGGGNGSSNPAWHVPSNGTTKLTYVATSSCSSPPTIGSKRLTWGGATFSGTPSGCLQWATANGTCAGVCGSLAWSPPIGTSQVSDGIWIYTTIPNSENSSTAYSMGTIANGTDTLNIQILPNTGTSLPIILECNNSNKGTIYTATSAHWYWVTRQFISTNGGVNTVKIYDNDGVTLLGSLTCTNTATADIQLVGFPGISGAETEVTGHVINYANWKIDRTGTTFPMLPAS